MKNVKITVMETMFNKELASEYGAADLSKCPAHKVGEVFIAENGGKPDGLCSEAWASIEKYSFALASGGDGFWSDWIEKRHISINSCSDGFRPVIFKLETLD